MTLFILYTSTNILFSWNRTIRVVLHHSFGPVSLAPPCPPRHWTQHELEPYERDIHPFLPFCKRKGQHSIPTSYTALQGHLFHRLSKTKRFNLSTLSQVERSTLEFPTSSTTPQERRYSSFLPSLKDEEISPFYPPARGKTTFESSVSSIVPQRQRNSSLPPSLKDKKIPPFYPHKKKNKIPKHKRINLNILNDKSP